MKLPIDLQMIILKTLYGIMSIDEFETWLYADKHLKYYLPEQIYVDLISLNFKEKYILHELYKLLADYVNKNIWWQSQLTEILTHLIEQPNDTSLLIQIYEWYCAGCYFMRLLALQYGLYAIDFDHKINSEDLLEIKQQATWILNALQNGEIELHQPEEDEGIFKIDYIDKRSPSDQKCTDLPY